MIRKEDVTRAIERHGDRLAKLPNVVGLGITEIPGGIGKQPSLGLAVYVSRKVPLESLADHEIVPQTLPLEGSDEAVSTRVVEVGAFATEEDDHGASGFTTQSG